MGSVGTVLRHWGVVPSQCPCLAGQGAVKAGACRRAAQAEHPGHSSEPSALLTTPRLRGTDGWWFACCLVSFISGWSDTRKNFNENKGLHHLQLHLSI